MRASARRAEPLGGLFVAVAWAAATFALSGLLAVVLDRDPIESEVPRLYGLLALAVATFAVWLSITRSARATRLPWPAALAAAAAVYFCFVFTGFIVSAAVFVEQASSPFVISAAVLAALAVLATWAALRAPRTRDYRSGSGGP